MVHHYQRKFWKKAIYQLHAGWFKVDNEVVFKLHVGYRYYD